MGRVSPARKGRGWRAEVALSFVFLRPLKCLGSARIIPQTRPPIKRPASVQIMRVGKMNLQDFKSMSEDELWSLHERLASVLAGKILAKKGRLEQRLRQLGQGLPMSDEHVSRARRPYPKVVPKFRNPRRPSETWAGRGKQPRWLTAQLGSGKKLDEFRIKSSDHARQRTR